MGSQDMTTYLDHATGLVPTKEAFDPNRRQPWDLVPGDADAGVTCCGGHPPTVWAAVSPAHGTARRGYPDRNVALTPRQVRGRVWLQR